MNREIKFRVWDKELRQWYNGECFLTKAGLLYFNDNGRVGHLGTSAFEVCFFTGLRDKNGKEIYEGDIVSYNDSKKHIGVIKYGIGCFYADNTNPSYGDIDCFRFKHCEVIGNIYELLTPQTA